MGRGTGGVRREKDRRGNERGEKTQREEKGTGTEKQEVTRGHYIKIKTRQDTKL